jgi:Transposase DDE domain
LEVVRRVGTPRHPPRVGHRRRQPPRRGHAHPTLDVLADTGRLAEIGTLHLDRGYDSGAVRDRLRAAGIDQVEIQRRGTTVPGVKKQPVRLGLRWIVEATNTWWSNYGQLRRNTDRRPRHAALCLATTILIIGRLLGWRNRWNPT